MTVVTGEMYAVGARRGIIFQLNAAGLPNATGASAVVYEGIELLGVKNFDLNIPPVRKIVHSGNDRVMAYDFLPSIEGAGGTLAVAGRDFGIDAMVGGVIERTLGEAKIMPFATDQQGAEPDVALFIMQQAKDASSRSRRYRFQIVPKCVISATPPGMNENASESKYELAISPTTKHLWGTSFVVGTDGCLEAGVIEGMTEGRPNVVAWLGDNVVTKLLFPVSKPATATGKIHGVWVNGVLDGTVTKAVDGVTPSAKPGVSDLIVCLYEY